MTLQYSQTKRAWSLEQGFYQENCAPRIVENLYGRAFVRRMRHKRHGQNQAWHIRQMVERLQADPEFLKLCADNIQVPMTDIASIPSFGEKYFLWESEKRDRKLRNMQKKSRKINRH